jgi:hypothetical protein
MEVYSVRDLSKKLNASQKAIRRYLKTGKLKGQKVFRKWMVSEDALRELLGDNLSIKNDTSTYHQG